MLLEQLADVAEDVEEAGHRRTGIAGEQVNAPLDFQGPLDEQFVAGEDFATGFGQEARVHGHVQSVLVRGTGGQGTVKWP